MLPQPTLHKLRKSHYKQGFFRPKNPNKYVGDIRNIIYRSSWELKFLIWCDDNPGILKYSSEETVIPYVSPVDGRYHRYFVDFKVTMNTKEGVKIYLVEIKPEKQTQQPIRKSKVTKSYIKESVTFVINEAKWQACNKYCKERGWNFIILTEKDLFTNGFK